MQQRTRHCSFASSSNALEPQESFANLNHAPAAYFTKQGLVYLRLELALLICVAGEIGEATIDGADLLCQLSCVRNLLLLQKPENLKRIRIKPALLARLLSLQLLFHQAFDPGHCFAGRNLPV